LSLASLDILRSVPEGWTLPCMARPYKAVARLFTVPVPADSASPGVLLDHVQGIAYVAGPIPLTLDRHLDYLARFDTEAGAWVMFARVRPDSPAGLDD